MRRNHFLEFDRFDHLIQTAGNRQKGSIDLTSYAVVGMAAYFTGVVQAPLTGIVLIIEMTGNYALILPLFIACFTTLLIVDWIGIPPIYEALMEDAFQREK